MMQPLLIIALLSFAYGQDRKIISYLNPGCVRCTETTTLIYVTCEGGSDTIHQIWDFTRSIPTVIFAVTSLNSTLNVSWKDSQPQKFILSEKPLYSFATAIDKLYEYDDLDDNGPFDPKMPYRDHKLNRVVWHRNESHLTDKEAMVHVFGNIDSGRYGRGTIHVKLDLIPFKDYAVDLPHLIHTANSTLFDVSLVNLTTNQEFNASRYAVHLILVSTDPVTRSMHYTIKKSLDDEHTPGVFEIIEIKTPALYDEEEGGYLQFRPVGYLQHERGVSSSTVAHVSNFNRTTVPHHSTLSLFYAGLSTDLLVQDMTVSFGEASDGYYIRHNYTAWSFTIGYGTPPSESFSWFIILIISIGVGVPVALALSGVAFVLLKRYRQPDSRARFVNED